MLFPQGSRPVPRTGWVREVHVWSLDVNRIDNDEDDRTGTEPLRDLLDLCRPAEGRIGELPDDCEARIHWSAYSDSLQGGFILPIELTHRIAALGVDMFTDVYLDDGEADGD